MGIGNIFDIASTGVTANRLAIEVAGENIANVNTAGYSRQQVLMQNKPVTLSNGFPLGTGVEIQTVRRAYDGMLQQQIVNGNSTYQQSLARQTALEQIEPTFNELATDGLGKAIDNFFGSWQDLTTNPQGSAERQALLNQAQIMIDDFHQANINLGAVAKVADSKLTGITAEISDKAKNLALVNTQLLATQSVGGNPNELLDQRDLLIRQISEKVGVSATLQNDGTAVLTLSGGQTLVNGTSYATLYTSPNGSLPPTNNILLTGLGNPPPNTAPGSDTNVSATVGGTGNSLGELGGTLAVRDSIVPGYLARLDELASRLVLNVNAQHASGYGIDGPPATTGNNFFAPAGTTSASIALDPGLSAVKIAAGLPSATDPAPTSSGNNGNALKLAALGSSQIAFSTGAASFEGFYNALVSSVGIDTQAAQRVSSQGESFLKQLNALRESNSGVSLDEELTNLTKYQMAFQGSAKVINTATEMLDTILSLVR